MSLLKVTNLSKTYGTKKQVQALKNFSLEVEKGEMIAIMGKSGSGKSTVLNLIAGIDQIENGSYFWENQDVTKLKGESITGFRRKNIGIVLQHFALIEDYNIFENIALPLRLQKLSKKKIREKVCRVAEELEIEKHLKKYPKELSGGEAQRVAIARAIVHEPHLILADEPTGALDEETEAAIMNIFKRLHEKGRTLIIVTHDKNVADLCQRTVEIRNGLNYIA